MARKPQVELDYATLSDVEHFALMALSGLKPDALPQHAIEFRKTVLGMTPKAQQLQLRLGIERLMDRGAVQQDGTNEAGQPIYSINCKLVTRVRAINPLKQ